MKKMEHEGRDDHEFRKRETRILNVKMGDGCHLGEDTEMRQSF